MVALDLDSDDCPPPKRPGGRATACQEYDPLWRGRRHRICGRLPNLEPSAMTRPLTEAHVMSRLRLLFILLVVLPVVTGVLWWLAQIYLSSQHITAQVASRLRAVYGGAVQVRHGITLAPEKVPNFVGTGVICLDTLV